MVTTTPNRCRSNLLITLAQSESVKQALEKHLSPTNVATLASTCKDMRNELKGNVQHNQKQIDKQDLKHLYLALKVNEQDIGSYNNFIAKNNSLYMIIPKYDHNILYVYNLDMVLDNQGTVKKLEVVHDVGFDTEEEWHDGPIFKVLSDKDFTPIAPYKKTGIIPTHKMFLALSVLDELSFLISCVVTNEEKKNYEMFANTLKSMIINALDNNKVMTFTDNVCAVYKGTGGYGNNRRKVLKLRS